MYNQLFTSIVVEIRDMTLEQTFFLQILRQLSLSLSPSMLLWFSCQYLHFFVLFRYTISCHKSGWSSNKRLKIIMKKVQIFSSILQTTTNSFFVLSQVNKQMEIRTMNSFFDEQNMYS